MEYIIANTEKVKAYSEVNVYSRRCSKDGRIMLNEKDLASVQGETKQDKILTISGTVINEKQALDELYKEEWQ